MIFSRVIGACGPATMVTVYFCGKISGSGHDMTRWV